MAQGHRKKSTTLLDEMLGVPWLLIFAVGVVVFFCLVWILPDLTSDNIILNSIAQGVAAVAWVVFGIFVLCCAAFHALASSTSSRRATHGNANGGSAARRRPPQAPPAARQALEEKGVAAETPSVKPGPAAEMAEPVVAPAIHDAWSEHAAMDAKPADWSIDVIRGVEWKRFEDLCQKFYETSGIRSETTALGPDGGMDILLYQDDSGKPTAIVQCVAGGECLVGVRPVRELLGVMTHEKISRAFFVTSGHFADAAKVVATNNRITLINGDLLLIMIKRLPEAARKSLLEFATEGDYKTPTCPVCGIKMKHLPGKAGSPDFWACHNYPRCRQKFGMGK